MYLLISGVKVKDEKNYIRGTGFIFLPNKRTQIPNSPNPSAAHSVQDG